MSKLTVSAWADGRDHYACFDSGVDVSMVLESGTPGTRLEFRANYGEYRKLAKLFTAAADALGEREDRETALHAHAQKCRADAEARFAR